jgi:hypothetical protein
MAVKGSLSIVALSLLVGCQTPPPPAPQPVPVDPVATQIDAVIATPGPAITLGPETPAPKPVFAPTVSVSYFGDVKLLLDQAAKATGMVLTVTGPHPHLPIYIQVNVKQVTMEAFLEDIARQLSQRADIVWRKGRNTLELRHRGQT